MRRGSAFTFRCERGSAVWRRATGCGPPGDPSRGTYGRPAKKRDAGEEKAARTASYRNMVASEGFEPPKAMPSDLQSDPFGR